jgi:hypothetical protein
MEEILNNIKDPQVKKDLKKIIKFHGFLSLWGFNWISNAEYSKKTARYKRR